MRFFLQDQPWIKGFGSLSHLKLFPLKSFFRALSNSPNIETTFLHRLVWKQAVPPRVKAFSWTAAVHRINTMDMLQKRRPFIQLSPQWCSLCKKDGESVHHIFLHCSFTYEVQAYFISRMGINWVIPREVSKLFHSWGTYEVNDRSKQFGEVILHAIIWGVWKERNNRIFKNMSKNCGEVIEEILREVSGWLLVNLEIKGVSLSDFIRDWRTVILCSSSPSQNQVIFQWKPPPNGILKLNFDGASKGNPGPTGFGCVIRDHRGSILKVVCGPLNVCNSIRAETIGLLFGLRELRKMGILGCIIEGDSEVVIGWGQGKECKAWRMWDLTY